MLFLVAHTHTPERCPGVKNDESGKKFLKSLSEEIASKEKVKIIGNYVAGALRKAEELKKKNMEGTIVTLIFDSIEYYKNILDIWMPNILGKKLDYDTFETLRSYAFKERSEHVKELRLDQNRLLHRMVESEAHAEILGS
jgi:hypothetical protein